MNVTYIYHSCFLIELNEAYLLFDYYKGTIPELKQDKPLYIFVSHRHHDHFNEIIFKIEHPFITYILSDDISINHYSNNTHWVKPNNHYRIDSIYLETLTSTDEGVAFMIEIHQQKIYFAGDLQNWFWNDEESEMMQKNYQIEVEKLWPKFDIAFVVLDPRLKEYYDLGLNTFLLSTTATFIFPMHMWHDYSIIDRYLKQNNLTSLKRITHKNQVFEL